MMPAHPNTPHLFVVEDRGYLTPCHVWTRAIGSSGYGILKVDGKVLLAHRHIFESEVGPIPEGLQIDHLCEVRLCVRADHLEPVTSGENTRRGSATKLTLQDVEEIRRARASGESVLELAARFGISHGQASKVSRGASWAA